MSRDSLSFSAYPVVAMPTPKRRRRALSLKTPAVAAIMERRKETKIESKSLLIKVVYT